MVLGFGFSNLIDDFLPDFDVDLDVDLDVDADFDALDGAAGGSGLAKLLAWLCPGKIPSLVLLILFLTTFGLLGLGLQGLAMTVLGTTVTALIAGPAVFFLTFPVLRPINQVIIPWMPKDETDAVSHKSFVGLPAKITLGVASPGNPAEAKLTDTNGKTHYLMVEPDGEGVQLKAGETIVIVEHKEGKFIAVSGQEHLEFDSKPQLEQKFRNSNSDES